MNTSVAERPLDGPEADNFTDELTQVESEPPVTDLRESPEPAEARENRGVRDGLKIIGLA